MSGDACASCGHVLARSGGELICPNLRCDANSVFVTLRKVKAGKRTVRFDPEGVTGVGSIYVRKTSEFASADRLVLKVSARNRA